MNAAQFKLYWSLNYPGGVPISHFFRHYWPERWFRIHSLPKSKRYAETPAEWEILLARQNKIVSDLLPEGSEFFLVTDPDQIEESEEINSIVSYSFVPLPPIDLNKIYPEEYEKGQMYNLAFAELTWQKNKFNELLKEIAEDKLRAFFLSVDQNCLIAPYDGGIDFILKDSSLKEEFKEKYKDWLSERTDGL